MKKIFAFTLAETLIVMGVIGIVSALTLPNLNSSTGEKEKIAKVKKLYQNFTDAAGRAQAVYGPFDEWIINDTTAAAQATRFGERLTEFMKVSKNCGLEANKGCLSSRDVLSITGSKSSGSPFMDSNSSVYKFILADGTSVSISGGQISTAGIGTINFDIDGPNKGNNQSGVDLFKIEITDNAVRYVGSMSGCLTPALGIRGGFASAFAVFWIMNYDNMDYLKLDNSSLKCPNGTQPTEENPRCK